MVIMGREAMLAVGCIQAQESQTGRCPTRVATQSRWRSRAVEPMSKGERVANYLKTLRRDLLKVSEAAGVEHRALIGPESVEIIDTLAEGGRSRRSTGTKPVGGSRRTPTGWRRFG
jgi:glutamate synthase (ferredoxin)